MGEDVCYRWMTFPICVANNLQMNIALADSLQYSLMWMMSALDPQGNHPKSITQPLYDRVDESMTLLAEVLTLVGLILFNTINSLSSHYLVLESRCSAPHILSHHYTSLSIPKKVK